MNRKIKSAIEKIAERVEIHSEFIRYLWPDKEISTRFKVLNFISADWLRHDVNSVRSDIYLIKLVLERLFDENGNVREDIDTEVYKDLIKSIKHYVDRTEKHAFEMFTI